MLNTQLYRKERSPYVSTGWFLWFEYLYHAFFQVTNMSSMACKILKILTIGSHEPCQPALPFDLHWQPHHWFAAWSSGGHVFTAWGDCNWLLSHQVGGSTYISVRGLSQNTCYSEIRITYEKFSTEESWHTCAERKCCGWRSWWVIWEETRYIYFLIRGSQGWHKAYRVIHLPLVSLVLAPFWAWLQGWAMRIFQERAFDQGE